ncbi:MAG: ABC transporter ATP-binding protein, partial [Adlercreutzia sp.]|nr:ABC transporter ATP-binding protein [Adlercreutzia sp.]
HQRGFGRPTDDDRRIIDWALSITHLDGLAERPIDALSGGQRQRAWIAMALAQDTGLILLDEPTTYLDMAHQLEVLELLQALNRDEGKTIALVIHELNLAARFSDWMIALKSGAIRGAGTPDEVMTPALLREVFGLDALIEPDPWTGRPSLVSYRMAGEEC